MVLIWNEYFWRMVKGVLVMLWRTDTVEHHASTSVKHIYPNA
jgi:hypothetical protein